jgi:hypothetical protein
MAIHLIPWKSKNLKENETVWRFIDKSWVLIKIAFDVRDGFVRTRKPFEVPVDINELSPARKQRITLCNLFANYEQSIEELAKYMEMDRKHVISMLIEEDLLKDQRRRTSVPIKGGRRECDRAPSRWSGTICG